MTLTFLDRFRQRSAAPTPQVFDGVAQVRAYWEALRRHGRLPGRSALDPRGLSGMLDRVFLAERIGHGLAQVRVAGSALGNFAGTDLRGLPLSCLFDADSRPLLSQTLERVFVEPLIAEFDLGSDRERAGRAIARLLLLPLHDEVGNGTLLGALSFGEAVGPCKLQVLSRREERIDLQKTTTTAPLFAPEETAQPLRRCRHLTLVHAAP